MRFISNEKKLDFSDVLLVPKMSTMTSRSQVDITRKFIMPHSNLEWEGTPIISANMDTTGTMEMAKALLPYEMCVALHKHYEVNELLNFFSNTGGSKNIFYSMGTSKEDIDKFKKIKDMDYHNDIKSICIDVANGYTTSFTKAVEEVRNYAPESIIMAGNVVTPERTEQIIMAGADIVKIGIGGGSVCTTRIKTSVGYPQLSSVIECADAAHGLSGLICSDGGCTTPGNIVAAFAGGADFVMLGGMLAGTDECTGEVVTKLYQTNEVVKVIHPEHTNVDIDSKAIEEYPEIVTYEPVIEEKKFKVFYGMSSKKANDTYAGGLSDYRAAEGKEVLIEYRGPVDNVIQDILGGLRSALTYTGSKKLKELTKRATFVMVKNQANEIFGKS